MEKITRIASGEPTASAALDALLSAMFAAWNRGDLHAYAGFWEEDGTLVNVVGILRQGRAEILDELNFLHAGPFRGTQITDLGHSVRFLAPDVAVIRVPWEMRGVAIEPRYGIKESTRRGIFTHTALRTQDGWRLVASQNTEIQPIHDPVKSEQPAA